MKVLNVAYKQGIIFKRLKNLTGLWKYLRKLKLASLQHILKKKLVKV